MAKAPEGTIGVKLSTPRRGCSGLAYPVDYVTEEVKFDEKIETPGGTFYIDGGSVLYLIGSVMDWREDDFTAGFVFENPNAKGRDRKSTRLNSSHSCASRMPSSAWKKKHVTNNSV